MIQIAEVASAEEIDPGGFAPDRWTRPSSAVDVVTEKRMRRRNGRNALGYGKRSDAGSYVVREGRNAGNPRRSPGTPTACYRPCRSRFRFGPCLRRGAGHPDQAQGPGVWAGVAIFKQVPAHASASHSTVSWNSDGRQGNFRMNSARDSGARPAPREFSHVEIWVFDLVPQAFL